YAPLDVSAVVFAYNITDPDTEQRVDDLVLSPRLVARLISNTDLTTFFQDPEFVKLNPNHKDWPSLGVAQPLLRAERTADAWFVTSWLNGDRAARTFLDGADPDVPVNGAYKGIKSPTDIFENVSGDTGYKPKQGELGSALNAFYGARGDGTSLVVTDTQGLI